MIVGGRMRCAWRLMAVGLGSVPRWQVRIGRSILMTAAFIAFVVGGFNGLKDMTPPAVKDWLVFNPITAVTILAAAGIAVFLLSFLLLVPASEVSSSGQLGLAELSGSTHRQVEDFDYEVRFACPTDAEGTYAVAEERFGASILLPFERHREWAATGRRLVRVMTEKPAGSSAVPVIISYYSVLPLSKATYEALLAEVITEKDLTSDKLLDWQHPELHAIYICAIVRRRGRDLAGAVMLRDLARYVRKLSCGTSAKIVAAWTVDRASTGYATDIGMTIVGRPKAYATSAFCEGSTLRDGADLMNNRLLKRFLSRPFEERYDPMP